MVLKYSEHGELHRLDTCQIGVITCRIPVYCTLFNFRIQRQGFLFLFLFLFVIRFSNVSIVSIVNESNDLSFLILDYNGLYKK